MRQIIAIYRYQQAVVFQTGIEGKMGKVIGGLAFLVVGYVVLKMVFSVVMSMLLWCVVGAALLGTGVVATKLITKK